MEGDFGNFLKQKRLEKNLTQKELAKMLFVSESAVSKWEKSVAHPDITLLPKLCEILSVSEHELITASVDTKFREEKIQAKRWRAFSFSWQLFWLISYGVTLLVCFICNLAINKTLSWFWIVFSALLLSFTFTNLPKFIKKYKLLFIPLSMYSALCILLAVCCIYTGGNWFFIPAISVLLGLVMIFVPIYIAKYEIFSKIRKYNDFISVGISFIVLLVLLVVINIYTAVNNYSNLAWSVIYAIPIAFVVYILLNIMLSVRFLKINRLLKTSIILTFINIVLYVVPMFLKVDNTYFQNGLDDINILKANFSNWDPNVCLGNNIHLIIFLTMVLLSVGFLIGGLIVKQNNKSK